MFNIGHGHVMHKPDILHINMFFPSYSLVHLTTLGLKNYICYHVYLKWLLNKHFIKFELVQMTD